ncbi:hypothetical protein [Vibrio hepatarius]|uniref:hypothetical protein n=1 Tax=Vibrio hepatarius TaxID=171383 RepID=UPI001C083D4B|nr:hypothetical protein [Vibrio hepatarius]MBU2898343.1 hypothetical protein [Vibrio hepatarius]
MSRTTDSKSKAIPPRTDFSVSSYYKELIKALNDESLDRMYEQRERILNEVGTFLRYGYGLSSAEVSAAKMNLWSAYGDRQEDFDSNSIDVTQQRLKSLDASISNENLSPEERLSIVLKAMS